MIDLKLKVESRKYKVRPTRMKIRPTRFQKPSRSGIFFGKTRALLLDLELKVESRKYKVSESKMTSIVPLLRGVRGVLFLSLMEIRPTRFQKPSRSEIFFGKTRALLLLIAILIFPLWGLGGNLSVSINADTILIGDIYTLELKVENLGNSKVFFPEYKDTIGTSKIQIVETYKEDTLENAISKKWDLSIYYPGAYQIAGFSALVQNENGSVDTLQNFDPFTVFVKTVAVDTSKAFKPIKPQKSIPYPWKDVLRKIAPYAIGFAILVAILLFLWYKYINRDKPKYVRPKTALDYHKEAIKKLKALALRKVWQEGNVKEYYLSISEILRTYLEGRFKLNAMESTTDEIFEDFRALGENKALGNKLKEVLQQCDLAKFAKFKPLGDENLRMMKLAQDFVIHTKPREISEEEKKLTNEKNTKNE